MKTFCFINYYRKLYKNAHLRRYFSKTASNNNNENIDNIRNIGILAHIDAGKTTTTERMLYYSGTIKSMGEVHHGNTVTDYMEQERQRGITITSAAVSFPWNGNQINLIDTPGHIDFTMEVEQSLAVLDGAVIVLDASAGVEAQTLTVWRQAEGYRVPRLFYLNKMDRADADEEACIKSIIDKLEAEPLLLHTPVRFDGRLIGLLDIVNQEEIIWTQGRGQKFTRRKLTETNDGSKWEETMIRHRALIDTLSSLDDGIADVIIREETLDNLNSDVINSAIRRCTIGMRAFPVLCGSSYKNIGVQTLMDAVISYLPTPVECNKLYRCFGEELAARAFKVQHDDQRGVLTFLRLYRGEFSKGQKIYSLAQNKSEQSSALYVAYADEYKPVEHVTAGNIAVVSGLKTTMTGDLVTSSQSAATRVKERLADILVDEKAAEELMLPSARSRLQAMDTEPTKEELVEVLLGIGTSVPEPVFVCAAEPPSAALQPRLEAALAELAREDPSLRVHYRPDTAQIVLAGMGELHLEIIKERIVREYKVDVELGPLQIAYREALRGAARRAHAVDRRVGGARQELRVTLAAAPAPGARGEALRLDKSADSAANLSRVHPRQLAAVRLGVEAALLHGPKLGCPLCEVRVTLHWLEVGRGTSDSTVTAAVAQCLRKVFEECGSVLLEPIMSLEVASPPALGARVLADLARRRALVHQVHLRANYKVIECLVPLSELLGYSSALRSLTSGLATFTMQFHSNRQMAPQDEEKAIRSVTGF